LAVGGYATGSINVGSDEDWFGVVLTSGTTYQFDVKGGPSGAGTLTDPTLALYDSSGAAVSAGVTLSNDLLGTETRLTYTASADGTYYIAASGEGGEKGSYAVSLSTGGAVVAVPSGYLRYDSHLDQHYLEAREGQSFRFQLPSNVFADAASEQLTFAATLGNGTALPSWLIFNAATRTFSGTPPAATGDLDIRLTARDPLGQFAAADFTLRTPPATSAPNAKWTVMIYVAADSNQAPYALKDLNEMESVLMPSGVNVVVMWDSNGSADTRRGKLGYDIDMATFKSTLTAISTTVTERNMGDPATLTEFIDWSASNYRADNYALVVWDRNGGGLTGTAVDFSSGRASLSSGELNRAIDQSTIGKVDLLGFDSNLSANIEQLREVRDQADYVVAPETLSRADGWDYAGWLLKLAADPAMSDTMLASAAKSSYYAYYGLNAGTTLQNLDSSKVDALVTALGNFVSASADMDATERTAIQTAVNANRLTGDASLVDVRGLMTALDADPTINGGDIEASAQALVAALDVSVGSDGNLSVFVSGAAGAAAPDYNAGNYRFVAESNWNSFVTTLYS
jgi:hypothetical protein